MIPDRINVGDKIQWPSGGYEIIIRTRNDGLEWQCSYCSELGLEDDDPDDEEEWYNRENYPSTRYIYTPSETAKIKNILSKYE